MLSRSSIEGIGRAQLEMAPAPRPQLADGDGIAVPGMERRADAIGAEQTLFSRVGYLGAQRCPIHWAGDQASTFSELRAVLSAGLSLGLSGVPFWSFDIGGFAGGLPGAELYLRATALSVFAPVKIGRAHV